MKLYKLKLKNFKIHKDKELEFDDKNLIIGENGTGKSSIFHAILFALFGSSSKEYIGTNKIANLVRELSSEAKIELEIEDNGKIYKIERILRRNGSSYATLKEKNKILASSPDLVRKKILDILNVNREYKILDVLYIPQGELGKYIKLSGKKDLTEIIERLFDIDFYSFILEGLKGAIRDLIEEKSFISNRIYQKERDISKFIKIYGNKKIEDLEKIVREYKDFYEKYKKLKEKYLEIKSLESNIDYELIEKEKEIRKNLENIENEINELEETYSNILSEYRSLKYEKIDDKFLNKKINELEKIKSEIENKIKDINKEELKFRKKELEYLLENINKFEYLKDYEKIYEEERKSIDSLNEELIKLRSIREEITNVLKLIEGKKLKRCPVCGKELSEEELRQIYNKKINELKDIEEKIKYLNNQLLNKKKKFSEIERNYKRLEYVKNLLQDKKVDVSRIHEEKEKILHELSNINEKLSFFDEYEKIESTINYLKKKDLERSLKVIKEILNAKKEEKNRMMFLINKIEISNKNIEKIKKILEELGYKSKEELENEVKNLEKELEKFKDINIREIELYKLHLEELNRLKEDLKKLSKFISNLTALKSVLERFIMQYRKKVAKKISLAFNYYFKKIYKYGDIKDVKVELKYERNEWKFYIYVKKVIDGKELWREVRDANLSGGQIKILDLAFRLGLSSLIKSNFKVLLLDEPTESLDENVRLSLAELLDSLKDYQIILCTHDEIFKEKMNGKVFEFHR